MNYLTLEVQINHGKVVPDDPGQLPESGRGLLTILPATTSQSNLRRKRVELPLIRGDGSRVVNPTPEELDASLWD